MSIRSQNELQRVVQEMRDFNDDLDSRRWRTRLRLWANRIDAEARRIEAAQAVAPGGGERCGANLHARRDPLYCAYPKGHEGPHGPRNYVDNRAMLAAAPASEALCGTCGKVIQPHPLTGTTCACAAASSAAGECQTCGGHGMIGYTTGQTPEQFEQHELPCPDCNEPDGAEQEQAGELPELPAAFNYADCGKGKQLYTANQMHAYARAALLRRAARVEVGKSQVAQIAYDFLLAAGYDMDSVPLNIIKAAALEPGNE